MAAEDHQAAGVEKRASLGGILAVILFAGIAVAAVVTIFYRQNQGSSAPAKANTVVMAQIAFNPKTLTAAKGSEVVFENKDVAPHNVTADDPKISSGTAPVIWVQVLGTGWRIVGETQGSSRNVALGESASRIAGKAHSEAPFAKHQNQPRPTDDDFARYFVGTGQGRRA